MNEPVATIVGTLGADPELRFTPQGAAVASFSVASTPRTLNKQTQQWEDGETLWMRCSVWREQAENVAESLTKGTRVIVTGRLKQRSWDDKQGNKRTVIEMDVDEVGPSLRWAQTSVRKQQRSSGNGGGFGGGNSDPWAQPVTQGSGYAGDEPPFVHATGYDLALQRGDAVVV